MSVAVRCRSLVGVTGKYVSRLRFMEGYGVCWMEKRGRTVLLDFEVADRVKALKIVKKQSYSEVIGKLIECAEEVSGEDGIEGVRRWLWFRKELAQYDDK